ncbi:CocE/NonD family hydrolase [Sandarakinorhabdus sp. AAP62]|uniref:CocE/NonD family hydrolase n=1 Tax=Sandarakinorhabdus sp. AAP62 TaxID=1248916 RepID=UPI0002EB8C44|nr:CocE/NonD family hydrolase [Sandarakinorhabdus sp. AAP62]
MIKQFVSTLALILAVSGHAQPAALTPTMQPDIGAKYDAVTPDADYVRREIMIPMRDGVKLFTVVVMKKGTSGGPILLTRTPYSAARATSRNVSLQISEILPVADKKLVEDGYIRVYQDVRGIHKSEGDYVMTRPLRGPLNGTATDHSTDAYDTIDWLVKNVPETNGRVAITGSSYPGFTSLMALIDPHPALKAAVPMSPMVDGWVGDDWFHNGAFRQGFLDYFVGQTGSKSADTDVAMGRRDYYAEFLAAGSAGGFAKKYGFDTLPAVKKVMEHPAYDSWWQGQALDRLLGSRPLTVPTMLVVGQWDQEDSYGAPAVYRALEPKDTNNKMLSLVIGPWRHSGVNYDGSGLGVLRFEGDTGRQFRDDVMKPFLDSHLKTGAPAFDAPPVLTYAVGADKWQRHDRFPAGERVNLYLDDRFSLSLNAPAAKAAHDDYVSDPAHPVPFVPVPVNLNDRAMWGAWLVSDQRHASTRPDVVTYVSPPLKAPLQIHGQPEANLFASTSGTDSDWVVKLIDVFPEENSSQPDLAGLQLGIGMEIFRGRYVKSFEKPEPLTPGKAERYRFLLPGVNHVIPAGHRLMVQVQSSWFPLYDRNPQKYVPNIFHAAPGDFQKATQGVWRDTARPSHIAIPVVGGAAAARAALPN